MTDGRTHDLILSKESIETRGVSLQFVKFFIVLLVPFLYAFTCLLFLLTHLSCHSGEDRNVNHESLQVLNISWTWPRCKLQLFKHSIWQRVQEQKVKLTYDKNCLHSLLFILLMRCNLIKLRTGNPAFLCGKFTVCSMIHVWETGRMRRKGMRRKKERREELVREIAEEQK